MSVQGSGHGPALAMTWKGVEFAPCAARPDSRAAGCPEGAGGAVGADEFREVRAGGHGAGDGDILQGS